MFKDRSQIYEKRYLAYMYVCMYVRVYIYIYIYRVFHDLWALLQEVIF